MKQHLSIISRSVGQKLAGAGVAGLPGFYVESYKTKFQIQGWPGLLCGDLGRIYFHTSSDYWLNPLLCCCGTGGLSSLLAVNLGTFSAPRGLLQVFVRALSQTLLQ